MPADRIHFLTVDEVLAIHGVLVERSGGPSGVRDAGLLESALFRPQTGYYADLEEIATAMIESLLLNHPFVGDNKPVAFFATDVFLRLNGWKFGVDADKARRFLAGLMEKDMCDFDRLLPWIRRSLVGVGER